MTKRITDVKKTILLIDDEPHYLDWLVDYLQAKDYRIVIATSLEQALNMLQSVRYRLVICDLSIPASEQTLTLIRKQQDAYGLYPGAYAAHMARNRGHRPRQVVVYSVHDAVEIERIAERIDVQYITKGRPAQLKREVDSILEYDPTEDA